MDDPLPATDARLRWRSLDEAIKHHARHNADGWAYIEPSGRITWAAYDAAITLLAGRLVEIGLQPGERVGVWLHDGVTVHVALNACLRAGLVAVGIGARSGRTELRYLMGQTGAAALVTHNGISGTDASVVFREVAPSLPALSRLIVMDDILPPLDGDLHSVAAPQQLIELDRLLAGRHRDPAAVSLINSTSGTTGLPKCVAHTERRWIKYHEYAADSAELSVSDVFMSVVPAPFGFGLWTSHFTPTLLGCPVAVLPRFSPREALEMLEAHGVTIFAAVCTQFVLILGEADFDSYDLTPLRAMFTGGEMLPRARAEEFERRGGCAVLNMYGSNETGVLSYTSVRDPVEVRLSSAGHTIDEVQVRLFDGDGRDITATGGPGRPASRGEVCSIGYYGDPSANAELFTPDGWMLMGDLVTIDPSGVLRVVGRTSDFIIRGGKNISAPAVEEIVSTHPAVFRCAIVGMPDPVFGERVCAYVVTNDAQPLSLETVSTFLTDLGVSREWFPEGLVNVDELPTSEGGKLAKAALRADIVERLAARPATVQRRNRPELTVPRGNTTN